MRIKKIGEEKKTKRMVLEVEGTTAAFMNAIRRTIVEFVPTMAIELVEFSKNDSILYDEIIANRLGLVPLKTDLKSYILPEEDEAASLKSTVKLTLKGKGPGVITAGQLKSKDPKIVPVFEDMPIAKLLKDQHLVFEATAQLGRGYEHAKWSPGHVWYRYKQNLKLNAKKIDDPKAFVGNTPLDIFTLKKGKVEVDSKKEAAYLLTIKTLDAWDHEAITIDTDTKTFTLHIEPWGQLPVKVMVQEASTILQEECKALAIALDNAQSPS